MDNFQTMLIFVAAFGVIALASHQIGRFFANVDLPLISGFLFAGIIAGPFVLGLVSAEAVESLRFVDEVSLAFIAFAAGSELYWEELRNRFKSIVWVTVGNVVAIPILGSLTIFFLADFIPFMGDMATSGRVAVSLLAGAILVARSPSSVIAIVSELRAKGPFTQTILGVTMVTDIAVIILFAVNSSVADALLNGIGFDIGFIGLLLGELLLSLGIGYLLSKLLEFILSRSIHHLIRIGGILAAGYGIFVLSTIIRDLSHDYLPFEIFLEPLLICMIGSFLITNYSRYRAEFLKMLHDVGLPIYIAFFTLTGAALALDVLTEVWLVALILFIVRLVAIFIGSFSGGVIARDSMNHNRVSWMAYVTQAGVGLGLAKEVAVEFPAWGAAFATMIIAAIVLSQIVGPPFIKWAINYVGEAHTRGEPSEFDGQRDAIIFGLEGQSLALARQLRLHNWVVKIATRKTDYMEEVIDPDIQICTISNLSLETLKQVDAERAEAIISMLADEESYQICELAYENFGTNNLVVRLNNRDNFERFHEMGVLIVNPATAVVSLLDQLVRSPTAASLLLGTTDNQDIVDVEVRNPSLHGVTLRNLRLPEDTLILSVYRQGRMLISHGYTQLKIGDRITVVGSLDSLEDIRLRFDT